MATIRKHRDKWQVQVRRRGYGSQSRSFTRKADAIEWAAKTERQAERRGLAADPRILDGLTVADVVRRFQNTIIPRRRGGVNETIVLNAFLRHTIANTKLSELRPEQFAAYRDERLQSVKAATINRELGLIQSQFEVARKEWAIPLVVNPIRE